MENHQRFFNHPLLSETRTVVHVGDDAGCGFRAVAAGILDNFFVQQHTNTPLLQLILQRHLLYYPNHRPGVMSEHWVESLLQGIEIPVLVKSMAYTLRQMTVDEMVASPASYPDAFVQAHEQTPPQVMRQPQTWLHPTSISALANALDLPIEVRVVQRGKELALPPRLYHADSPYRPVVIELENQHYRPSLLKPAMFISDVYDSQHHVMPNASVVNDPDIQDILKQIAEVKARMEREFEKHRIQLKTMVSAGELNKKKLLGLYIKGMNRSDYLQGPVKYADKAHQSDFFSREIVSQSRLIAPSFEEALTEGLINALALAVSVDHLSAEDIFRPVDEQPEYKAR